MIPATPARMQPIMTGDMNGMRINRRAGRRPALPNPIGANSGRLSSGRRWRKKTGIETAIPSGMLCMAMATAMAIPSVGFSTAVAKVAMPSGKLWMPIARAVISPMRISLAFFGFFLQLFDHMGFVRVLDRRHQPVDDADQEDAGEETRHGDRRARADAHSAVSERFACWNSSTNET